jgi:hypothetical protein
MHKKYNTIIDYSTVILLLLLFTLSSCANPNCVVTYFPPGVDCHYSGSQIKENLKEFFATPEKTYKNSDKMENLTEDDFTAAKKEEFKMVFYETGYLKEATFPNDVILDNGYRIRKGSKITFYQPSSHFKSIIQPNGSKIILDPYGKVIEEINVDR